MKTRRGFLKFLGKAAVVGAAIAVAPKTVLGFKPQEVEKYGTLAYRKKNAKSDLHALRYSGGPMTATEVIARNNEFNETYSSFIRVYEKEVLKAFEQSSPMLRKQLTV